MGEMRPLVLKALSSILVLGLLPATVLPAADPCNETEVRGVNPTPIDLERTLRQDRPTTTRLLAAPPFSKDADDRQDEEEGNDEIDIVLITAPPPDGAATVDVLVRLYKPGVLAIDAEGEALAGSLTPVGDRRDRSYRDGVLHADAAGTIAAGLWPGDYFFRLEGDGSVPDGALRFRFFDACASPEEAASLLCSTPLVLGEPVTGELANRPGLRAGLFTLVLTGWQAVEIATSGRTDTVGRLYDRAGRLLAVDDDGGENLNFRIVRTLSPGRYFVRLEGRQAAEGPYVLSAGGVHR